MRPKKVRWRYQRGNDSACALGAAAIGSGWRAKRYKVKGIIERFPCLGDKTRHPLIPERSTGPYELWYIVSRLSDETKLSREEIADWLCCMGRCNHPLVKSGNKPPCADQFMRK